MNLRMGSQVFRDVTIPLLWGQRAVVQDRKGRLSIIDLSGENARIEILADQPAPGVYFLPRVDGIVIMRQGSDELYSYNAREKLLVGISLRLPECQIGPLRIRVGGSVFSGNVIAGYEVGIAVSEHGMTMGGPLPPGLAKLAL
jgi:hypothetical protein